MLSIRPQGGPDFQADSGNEWYHRMMDSTHAQPATARKARRRLAFAIVPLILTLGAMGVWSLVADAWLNSSSPNSRPPLASIPGTVSHEPSAEISAGDPRLQEVTLTSHESAESTDSPGAGKPLTGDELEEHQRKQVVGRWQDEYRGKRCLTIRNDGTATMVVEPDGIGKKLFAERLTFEIEWTFDDGRIVMTMTSGEPKSKTSLVMKLYGTRAEYSLLNLDDQQLLLLDGDGATRYDWRRINEEDRE